MFQTPYEDPHAQHRPRNGGTFIENFGEEIRHVYEQAIKQHGDPNLVIREPVAPCLSGGSLHDLTARPRDLGAFWRVFDSIESEQAA